MIKLLANLNMNFIQHQALPLPGSQDPSHIQENFDVISFEIKKADMDLIDSIASKGQRK